MSNNSAAKAVSIIVPAYNAAPFLAETIESVLAQTFTDWELIVIDDGSTDATAAIATQYCQQDERIQLHSQQNQGVSASRNVGLQITRSPFIAFLDADDIWSSNNLAIHIERLSSDAKLGLSFARVEFMSVTGESLNQYSHLRLKHITSRHLFEENLICTPSNAVMRRAALEQSGGFDRDLSGYADMDLFLRISCAGWKVEGVDQVLVRYRTNAGGMSAQLECMEQEWYRFSNQVKTYAPDLVGQYHAQAKASLLRYLARRSLRLGLPPTVGVGYINRSFQSDWRLLLREPRRTLLTALAVYGRSVLPNVN